jgi:inorganic triphosphatase YgiF
MTVAEPIERELKLDIEPAAANSLATGPWFTGASCEHIESVYFDTADQALRKAGYLLRVRHNGDRRIQTLKAGADGASGLFLRHEWEREISGDRPEITDGDGPLQRTQAAIPHAHRQVPPPFDRRQCRG